MIKSNLNLSIVVYFNLKQSKMASILVFQALQCHRCNLARFVFLN